MADFLLGGFFMEESILKYAEFGILGVITLLLLTKGINSLIKLSETTAKLADSQKTLADSINKLADRVVNMDIRLSNFGHQIENIEKHLEKFEDNFSQNFNELRDFIKNNYRRKE